MIDKYSINIYNWPNICAISKYVIQRSGEDLKSLIVIAVVVVIIESFIAAAEWKSAVVLHDKLFLNVAVELDKISQPNLDTTR